MKNKNKLLNFNFKKSEGELFFDLGFEKYNEALINQQKQNLEQANICFSLSAFLFTKSAELGFGPAQHNLAYMYDEGEGVGKNLTKANYWYKKYFCDNQIYALHY